MRPNARLAIEAWEALLRAEATVAHALAADDIWGDLVPNEYGVLYALASAPTGKRMSELNKDVLLSQPGLSRLIARLKARGLIASEDDPEDGRASLVCLSPVGRRVQRRIGAAHARRVARTLSSHLSEEEMSSLKDLCIRLVGRSTRRKGKGGNGHDRSDT